MNAQRPSPLLFWLGLLLLAGASLVLTGARLSGLPQLGISLGPDLTVRAVRMDRGPAPEAQQFQRGDRLVAIQRQALEDLRDLRAVLPHAPLHADRFPVPGEGAQGENSDNFLLEYQIVRPLHRFALAAQGDLTDPTGLPAGVEPNDRLVEIDGRLLPGKVGVEGLRSVMASRPEALLSFERQNAVFEGQMRVDEPGLHFGIFVAFGLALLVMLVLWRYHNEGLHRFTALAVAAETLCFAWISLLGFQYQWILSDYLLTSMVIFGLVMVRPFAIFARDRAVSERPTGGTAAVAIGLAGAASLVALLYGNHFPDAEVSLHAAAILAGLFIIYEVVITGIDRTSSLKLGERGGYLAGIVILSLFAALITGFVEPVAFEEDRWRWFAVLIPALVWFGDVLFCTHNAGAGGAADMAEPHLRHELIRDYFEDVALELPPATLTFVVYLEAGSIAVGALNGEVSVSRAPQALHDATAILIQEGARVPLPDTIERQAHPMGGIAQAMNLVLALELRRPAQGVFIEGVSIALFAEALEPLTEVSERTPEEALDDAQQLLTSQVWSAVLVEALAAGVIEAPEAPARVDGEALTRECADLQMQKEALEAQLAEAQETATFLRADRSVLADQLQVLRQHQSLGRPNLDQCQALLEAELVDGLRFLLDLPDPIVLAGARGTGKEFVAWCAHLLDERPPEGFVVFDASTLGETGARSYLFGPTETPHEGDEGLIALCRGGSLLIRSAEILADSLLLDLCHAAAHGSFRLFLAFQAADAEERSVLDGRAEALTEQLGYREIIIPHLMRRRAILRIVLQYILERCSRARGVYIDGFSSAAMQALEAYDYPGELLEAWALIDAAVVRSPGDVIDLEDLNGELQSLYAHSQA